MKKLKVLLLVLAVLLIVPFGVFADIAAALSLLYPFSKIMFFKITLFSVMTNILARFFALSVFPLPSIVICLFMTIPSRLNPSSYM